MEMYVKEEDRKGFSWGKVLLVAGLGFAAVMIWMLADFGTNAESVTNVVPTVDADASYECPETLAILATTSRPCTVTIQNREGRSLTGVTLSVNGEYTFNVGSSGIGSYEAYSLDLADFAKRDGTRFNIVSTRILSMSLRSDQGSANWTFEEK
jgi:hypothetical protein